MHSIQRVLSSNYANALIPSIRQHGLASFIGKTLPHIDGFDASLCDKLKLESVSQGQVTCSFTVDRSLGNSYGSLHGGAICTVIDIVGTLALLEKDHTRGGVSLELNSSFLRAAKIGDRVICVGRVLKYGGTVGFTEVVLYRDSQSNENKIATGRHTKYLAVKDPSSASAKSSKL
jgi:acyl-coenzyme A thioesterase 13